MNKIQKILCADMYMVIFLLCAPYLWYLFHSLNMYIQGQKQNGSTISIGAIIILFITVMSYITITLVLLIKVFLRMQKIDTKPNRSSRLIVFFLVVGSLILFFVIPFPAPAVYFLKGFALRMNQEADIPSIRREIESHMINPEKGIIDMNKWPSVISRLSPNYVSCKEENGKKYINIEWGVVSGHWGLVIGPKDMQIPKNSNKYVIPLDKPGAYVWHEKRIE